MSPGVAVGELGWMMLRHHEVVISSFGPGESVLCPQFFSPLVNGESWGMTRATFRVIRRCCSGSSMISRICGIRRGRCTRGWMRWWRRRLSGGFEGATADALRDVVSGRLKTFVYNIARAFSLAGEAVAEYRLVLVRAQQAVGWWRRRGD